MGGFLGDYWPEILLLLWVIAVSVSPGLRRQLRRPASWYLQHVPSKASTAVAALASIVAVVVPFAFDSVQFPERMHILLLLVSAQGLVVGLPLLVQGGLKRALAEARSAAIGDVTRTLVPFTGLVRAISEKRGSPREKRELQGRAHQVGLAAAALLLGRPGEIRASWFLVEGASPRRRLVPPDVASSVGRDDMARTVFQEETPLGRTIFASLSAGQPSRCSDILIDPPSGWVPHDTRWRSFLSVPVVYGGVLVGMLTVDSPRPHDFDALDDAMALALAQLFATAVKS